MTGTNSVYRCRPAPGFGHWAPAPGTDLSEIEFVTPQTWTPQALVFDDTHGSMPDFARIDSVDGVMVIRNDDHANYGVQFFSSVASGGQLFNLSGDAEGHAIFRPTVWKAIDTDASVGLDEQTVSNYSFHPDRIGEGLFRSIPRTSEIYCAHRENDPDEITDLDDIANMSFKTWYELAAITGFNFEPIWRS